MNRCFWLTSVCMVLIVGLVVLVAHYAFVVAEKDNTILGQNSQIASLQAQKSQVQSWLDGNKTYYEDWVAAEIYEIADKRRQIEQRDSVIADLNGTVVSLNTEVSLLARELSRALLNVTADHARVSELSLNASAWVNKTVLVEGNLRFLELPIVAFAWGWKWNYLLSSNGSTFWLLWEPDWFGYSMDPLDYPPSYDGLNAIIIGIVRQTPVYDRWSDSYVPAYYIDAEKIVPL